MTTEQTKFVLDNLSNARKAAAHWSRGEHHRYYDELLGVSNLELVELADKDKRPDNVYWHLRTYVWCHIRSRAFGRASRNGSFPVSLDAISDEHGAGVADAIVHKSIVDYGLDGERQVEVERKECKRGHELTPANTIPSKQNFKCRRCHNQLQAERRKAKDGTT